MATKAIRSTKLTDNLTLSECKDGYWLYDYTRGMNLAMCAETREDAFVKAITYYQERLKKVERDFDRFNKAANVFIDSVSDGDLDS